MDNEQFPAAWKPCGGSVRLGTGCLRCEICQQALPAHLEDLRQAADAPRELAADVRNRLKISIAEYDRIAGLAVQNGDLKVALDATRSGADIKAALLALGAPGPRPRQSYEQLRDLVAQLSGILAVYVLDQGGRLILRGEATARFGASVRAGRYDMRTETHGDDMHVRITEWENEPDE
jgi:hypothetical protein